MEVEDFIARWTAREGGAERANYQMFLAEFCDVIGVARPEPAGVERELNDYVFERAVRRRDSDPVNSSLRIDLYKKGSFILEAKQSRLPGGKNALPERLALPEIEPERLGQRGTARNWDTMMASAREQAERYVFLLDADHPAPPFLITCDVGHAFEIFADFSGSGRGYSQFPDRKRFRIYMEDLRDGEVREMLARIWTDPAGLDPAKESARVTRGIARRLAEVSKALEERGHEPEAVAQFLMRCLFTMFAEDVELLPKDCFKDLLCKCVADPSHFQHRLRMLWQDMNRGTEFSGVVDTRVRHFNGGLFRDTTVFPLDREEIGELLAAAKHKWTEVDPAIFGTLLEQALDRTERRRLGAHYTPRAYVQRLVEVTVMEPLREDWRKALTKAQAAKDEGKDGKAIAILRAFLHYLCNVRVLDPACGTANFLYVSLELMKKLEGEVLEVLARLGFNESLGLEHETVEPRQFLGLETNPRAAAIAELVVWIGYLQQHYRTNSGHPGEPILKAFRNINFGRKDGYDAVLVWDGYPAPQVDMRDGRPVEVYPNARRPEWPEAEFIVGNPPFLGKGAAMRGPLGDAYVDALWSAHPHMNESADFVMYWWDHAAELLTRKNTSLRRFGLVTTNSIGQVFNRRTIERHLTAKPPVSIVFAISDHPWTKATKDAAAVRIAMTAAEAGDRDGLRAEIISEGDLQTDDPQIVVRQNIGRINADLSIGADLTRTYLLRSNSDLSWNGMMLAGRGFVLSDKSVQQLNALDPAGTAKFVKPFLNGGDLVRKPQSRHVIDFFGLTNEEARTQAPAAYSHILGAVKPDRDKARDTAFRNRWWLFGRSRPDLRSALLGLTRYVATTETAKHRLFQFISAEVVPDHMVIAIASDDAAYLAILSSSVHCKWALAAGGWLGVGNDPRYSKSRCFDPFPFPELTDTLREQLRSVGEELDATRKRVLEGHPDLTLTGLYNVLEKIKAGTELSDRDEDVKERGLVLILKELHETIDRLTAEAYGWPADLVEEEMLERLVTLNAERAREEAAGHVRWLRPEYQIPRFGKGVSVKSGELAFEMKVVAIDKGLPVFPADRDEQVLAVEAMLVRARRAMDAAELARGFRRGGKRIEKRVGQLLVSLARYGHITALPDGRFAAREGGRLAA